MRKNVIVMTTGLSGSSVLTGLIASAGYWAGAATVKKPDYDTFENAELVALNRRLLQAIDYREDHARHFSAEAVRRVAELSGSIDMTPYRRFAASCAALAPFVWKDPRLWLTIRFWHTVLDLRGCTFLMLDRDPLRAWVSMVIRRKIMTYRCLAHYKAEVSASVRAYLAEIGVEPITLIYEDLIWSPNVTLARLNAALDTTFAIDDLLRVYDGTLSPHPGAFAMRLARALLIYSKNYGERQDVKSEVQAHSAGVSLSSAGERARARLHPRG